MLLLLFFACQSEDGVKAYNVNPEITITSHSDGGQLEDGVVASFRAAASDPNHDASDLLVSWYIDTELVCDWAAPDLAGTSYCDINPSIDATRIVAEVRDPDGAGGQSEIGISVIPTDAPTITLSAPNDAEHYTSDLLIEFSAVVSDTEDGPEDLSVIWSSSIDGILALPEFADSDGLLTGSAYLSEGQHFIQATVTDSTAKESQTDVTILVGPPNTLPNCHIDSPLSNGIGVLGETIHFEGEATDAESEATSLSAVWTSSLDGEMGTSTPTSDGSILYATDSLSAGTHTIRLDVSDGLASCADEIFLTIGEPPSVQIDAPLDGATVNEDAVVSFSGIVSDDSTAENQLSISWMSSLDGLLSDFPATSSGLTQATGQLSAGQHIITLQATDGDGLVGDASIILSVNALPTQPSVSLSPDPAYTSSTITATAYGSTDADGQAVSYSYVWYKNGALTSYIGAGLASTATAKGESWTVEATPTDGIGTGPVGSAGLIIQNSSPQVSGVMVSPSTAQVGDTLTCSATISDPDETPVDAYTWTNQTTGAVVGTSAVLIFDETMGDVGDILLCEVSATDSDGAIASGSATASIVNSDPVISGLTLSPNAPISSETLTCSVAATDPDGDSLTITYSWTLNGVNAGTGSTLDLAGSLRGDMVSCTASVTDTNGGSASATVVETVANQIPVITAVVMSPDPPSTQSVMTCTETASDGDGDALTTSIDWHVNGSYVTTAGFLAGPFSLNDIIQCEVTVNDGYDDSLSMSAELTISNGPPVISSLTLSPDPAGTNDDLTANVVVSDPEGDAISLGYSWSVNGVVQPVVGDLLGASLLQKSDVVSVTVTPSDSMSMGVPQTVVLVISNTPPEAASISINPPSAQESVDLICEIDVGANDIDGDAVTYAFSWMVNGSVHTGAISTTNYTGDTIPSTETVDGDIWECMVTPNDGSMDGPIASAQASVLSVGCSSDAEWMMEVVSGMWACVNDSNITSYTQNFDMCAAGFTPVTYDLAQSLGLPYPTQQENSDFWSWYQGLPTSGDTSYIRTGQKRRGGCSLNDHGELYIAYFHGYSSPGAGWYDLYYGGGSCSPSTSSANNVSGHPLAGVLCVFGSYVPPYQ